MFYNFENDSYVLSAEKEDVFYVVVPKGEYTTFEVNFVEQSGKVYSRTFDATGDKQLLGGKVREFPSVEFDLEDCENMLLIGTDVDMETFASAVKAGTFNTTYDGALLVSDVDMTGKAWESLDGFSSLLEGRGYTIKGLTAPLFGENITGTISNVNVEGNVVETKNGKVGLIARSLAVAGDQVGTIFNCSAAGSIEYNNSALTLNNDLKLINIGGVVGGVYGGKVSLAEATVNVTVTAIAGEAGKTTSFIPCIGGVVGYACADGENNPLVVENTSNGAIVWDDQSKSVKAVPYIGGVAGYVTAGSFENNVNTGVLAINEPMDNLDWGGVIGASAVSVVDCENKGSLTINEAITKANIGGVLGLLESGSANNCENSGTLYFGEKFKINSNCNIGGAIAYANVGTKDICNCSNSGSITYLGECAYSSRTALSGNANVVLGGVLGTVWSESVEDCRNLETAEINVAGKIAGNGDRDASKYTLDKLTSIAGVIGVRAGRQANLGTAALVSTKNCSNQGNVSFTWQYCGGSYLFSAACIGIFDSDAVELCKNEGTVGVQADIATDLNPSPATTSMGQVYVSGLFGCFRSNCDYIKNCSNTGNIKVSNSNARMMYVSGLVGITMNKVLIKLNNCANEGNILVDKDVYSRNVFVGSILASTYDILVQYDNCYNSGTVETRATAYGETNLGSIFGWSSKANIADGTKGVSNSGQVIYSGQSAIAYVGGYCGRYDETLHTVEFENTANGKVEYKGNANLYAFVGGIAGLGGSLTVVRDTATGVVTSVKTWTGITGGEFTGMTNNGNVTINGYAPNVYVSGCFGYLKTTGAGVNNLTNGGTVEVPDMSTAKNIPDNFYVGGIFGNAVLSAVYPTSLGSVDSAKAISECHNSGDIIYKGMARDGAYVGGIGGLASKAPICDCTNSGKVISEGHAGSLCPEYAEAGEKADTHDLKNYHFHDIAIGGIVGETDLHMSGCENNGEVSHSCLLSPLRISYLGELATSRFDVGGIAGRVFTPEENKTSYKCSFNGLVNNGNVTILGTPSATLCSPSADMGTGGAYQWSDIDDNDRQNKRLFTRVNAAGLIGRMMDLSSGNSGASTDPTYHISGSTNNGNINVPEAGKVKCLSVAGGVADILVSHLYFSGVHNKGNLSVDNAGFGTTVNGGKMMYAYFINMGGVAATYFDYRLFKNTSDILSYVHHLEFDNCTNEGNIHYGEVGASVYQYAGGILGQVLHSGFDRCVDTKLDYKNKLYVSQAHVKFTNCKNSGNIDYSSQAMNLNSAYNYNHAGGILGSSGNGLLKAGFVLDGSYQWYGNASVTCDHCENTGDIQWDRSNGAVSTNKEPQYTAVGGIIGSFHGSIGHYSSDYSKGQLGTVENGCNAQIISCKNSGRIHGFSGMMGGIIGAGTWYVKITGTEEDPTINTGDIAIIRENGKVVTRGRYGNKYTYAGGIAGVMFEYISAAFATSYPNYMPEHQYCRIEYAVNEGTVGATGMAGGIAGFYWSAVEPAKRTGATMTHRGGLQYCRNTGSIYALEQATTNVGSIVGKPRIFVYTASDANDVAKDLSAGNWPLGVKDCYVGGYILRGAVGELNVNESNYQNAIYGEGWDSSWGSISENGTFDGCTFYAPVVEEPTPDPTPEDPTPEETTPEDGE